MIVSNFYGFSVQNLQKSIFIWNFLHCPNDAIFSFRGCILKITHVNLSQHSLISMSSHSFCTSKWCFAMLPFSAWRTAIRLHETASGFSATVGPTTHRPSIVLYAYGPSSWLGITSNGWRASTQFAPNPHLCCHFLQENLIFFPNIATVLA